MRRRASFCHYLAGRQRREGKAAGGGDERHFPGAGALANLVDGLLVAVLELLLHHPPPGLVLVALEGARDAAVQILEQLRHGLAEAPSLAGGEAQRARPVRLREVVHVAPVGRRRLAGRPLFQKTSHHPVPARAGRAEDEQVVAVTAHAGAELERGQRPLLTHHVHRHRELGGALVGDQFHRAGRVQLLGCQGGYRHPLSCVCAVSVPSGAGFDPGFVTIIDSLSCPACRS
jgi:hypothetical protein